MATNFYFQSGIPGGRVSEKNLMEDLIIECLKIYGFDVYYIPRKTVYEDDILNEDALNSYEQAYALEMYLANVDGFNGEGDLLSKFGVEIRDTASFIVSKRRWEDVVAKSGHAQLTRRPAEGDILYFPLTKSYFEIRKVETSDPFFQVGKLYVFKMECELMQFSSERFNTGINEIDNIAGEEALDISQHEVLLESGDRLLLEYFNTSSLILESYSLSAIDPLSQNEAFSNNIDILDFTEQNPFGEVV
jgi:hypothetical protein